MQFIELIDVLPGYSRLDIFVQSGEVYYGSVIVKDLLDSSPYRLLYLRVISVWATGRGRFEVVLTEDFDEDMERGTLLR